jgi:hypothetical protein
MVPAGKGLANESCASRVYSRFRCIEFYFLENVPTFSTSFRNPNVRPEDDKAFAIPDQLFGGGSTEHRSIRKRDFKKLATIGPIAERMDRRGNGHSRTERPRLPTLARQAARSVHLNHPFLRAPLSVNRQHDPRMRARPLELLDRPLQGYLPLGIEPGKRVVRLRADRGHANKDVSEN